MIMHGDAAPTAGRRVGGDEAQRLVRRGRVNQLSAHEAAATFCRGRAGTPVGSNHRPFNSAITDPLGRGVWTHGTRSPTDDWILCAHQTILINGTFSRVLTS
jgi:hypothetical protein